MPTSSEYSTPSDRGPCRPERWAHRYLGSHRLATADGTRQQTYQSACIFGAICPDRSVGAAIIMPYAHAEAMNLQLMEISTKVAPGAHAMLICDGAGWHQQGGRLVVPGNITLLPLPPYCPDLNSMENVWAYLLRQNKLCATV